MNKKINMILLITFIITILVPITGKQVHKIIATLFLLLCLIHAGIYIKKMNTCRYFILILLVMVFLSGLFAMIYDQYSILLAVHKVSSLAFVSFSGIHIFVFKSKLFKKKKSNKYNYNTK